MIRQAMILAAGRGERMRPLTLDIPKPLLKIGEKPILSYTLDALRDYGVKKIIINAHHLAEQILLFAKDVEDITVIEESILLETGGGVLNALDHFDGKPFFVINGDVLWRAEKPPFAALEAAWDPKKMDILLGVIPLERSFGYDGIGDFEMAKDGKLYDMSKPGAPYINTSIKIFHPRIFEGAQKEPFSNKKMYQKALDSGRLYGVELPIHWFHFGDPAAFKEGSHLFLELRS